MSNFIRSKKLTMFLFAIILVTGTLLQSIPAKAAITGNDSLANAYVHGSWTNTYSDTTIIEPNQEAAYFKFTVNTGERIYAKIPYSTDKAGMSIDLLNASGLEIVVDETHVYKAGTALAFMAVSINGTSTAQTFYLRINRGTVDTTKAMYVSYSFYDRIKSSSKVFNFTGTASNPGNNPYVASGVDSSILKLNLTSSDEIPDDAIVKSVTTAGTQSPSQGGVKHKIMPSSTGTWVSALASSATRGSYSISLSNGIPAKQEWQFRYNATAGAPSSMKNVKLTLNWEYDLADTNYELFTS